MHQPNRCQVLLAGDARAATSNANGPRSTRVLPMAYQKGRGKNGHRCLRHQLRYQCQNSTTTVQHNAGFPEVRKSLTFNGSGSGSISV